MIKAKFKLADYEAMINTKVQAGSKAVLNAYNLAGLEFVKEAREKTKADGGFGDITGNLRSSIGYIILQNGKQIEENFEASDAGTIKVEGVIQGIFTAQEIAQDYSRGLVLICVAGMDYAAAVESRGYDVITGSSLNLQTRLKELLKQI
jgi:hypothetical protein